MNKSTITLEEAQNLYNYMIEELIDVAGNFGGEISDYDDEGLELFTNIGKYIKKNFIFDGKLELFKYD